MPRSSRNPGEPCSLPSDEVIYTTRPRRGNQRVRSNYRVAEEASPVISDAFLLPVRVNTTGVNLTQFMLGHMSWFTYLACFLRTQAQQVLFNTCRCKQLCQKLMEKTGVLVLCAFGFWMFSMHLPSKMEVWQDDSINSPLQSLRMYQEKVRYHSGEIQDLRGSLNLLIAKLQQMEAMSDEPNMTPGNCWAFAGDHGQVTIRLAQKVYLTNITLQHIPKTISLSGCLDTAPKDFVIYGMESTSKEEVFLGAFQFQPENTIQMFPLQNDPPRGFGAVKVKISSNWGNPRFTCLYRVRVHGSVTLPKEMSHLNP
ncbi:SUN domain-containing protein 5 isoform 4-T4 [Thomomys bottae]